jgi:hypothetical protein
MPVRITGVLPEFGSMLGEMRLTENHIRQLHQTVLRHSDKDERHRGSYKTLPNNVVASARQSARDLVLIKMIKDRWG